MASSAQFRRVEMQGRLFRGPGIEVQVAARQDADPVRVGVAIRRGVVRTSVERNHWKRWVREIVRTHPKAMPQGCDVVVSLTHPSPIWRYQDMEQQLTALFTQAQETLRR